MDAVTKAADSGSASPGEGAAEDGCSCAASGMPRGGIGLLLLLLATITRRSPV